MGDFEGRDAQRFVVSFLVDLLQILFLFRVRSLILVSLGNTALHIKEVLGSQPIQTASS